MWECAVSAPSLIGYGGIRLGLFVLVLFTFLLVPSLIRGAHTLVYTYDSELNARCLRVDVELE